MADIFRQKGSPYWYVTFQHQGRRIRRSLKTSDRKTALLIAHDIEVKIAKGEYLGIREDPKVSFRVFAEEYLTWAETNRAPATASEYRWRMEDQFLPVFGGLSLSQTTAKKVEDWRERRAITVSPQTANNELANLRAMLNRAVAWGYLRENPARGIKPLRIPKRIPRFLSQEEAARLLEAADPYWRAFIALGLYAGLRLGEILYLRWGDVDLQRGLLSVQPHGEWQPKNREVRRIPLAPALLSSLEEHRRAQPMASLYVFPKPNGNPYSPWPARHSLSLIADQAGLQGVHPHVLRHTFASWLVMEGVDLVTVSRLLGHSNIQMTMAYAHLAPDHLRAAVSKLEFGRNLGIVKGESITRTP